MWTDKPDQPGQYWICGPSIHSMACAGVVVGRDGSLEMEEQYDPCDHRLPTGAKWMFIPEPPNPFSER